LVSDEAPPPPPDDDDDSDGDVPDGHYASIAPTPAEDDDDFEYGLHGGHVVKSEAPQLSELPATDGLALNHRESDTARQGNDYEYFINVVCRQKRVKHYFDVQTDDISELFDLYEEIGQGGYSVVRRAVSKDTGEERAVKLVPMHVYAQHKTRMEAEVCDLIIFPSFVRFWSTDGFFFVSDKFSGCCSWICCAFGNCKILRNCSNSFTLCICYGALARW
jgi:hypothetical protein